MPIVNNLVYQNESWINKPHTMDESPPLTLSVIKTPATLSSDEKVSTPIGSIKKKPALPATLIPPTPPLPPRSTIPLQGKTPLHTKRKSFCFSNRRKTMDFSFIFRENLNPVRPRSMDSLLSQGAGTECHHGEKPLPAVPIEPRHTTIARSSTLSASSASSQTPTIISSPLSDKQLQDDDENKAVVDFEPLTLKDITLILDRNDRMAAYTSAYEKCINTPSPLVNSVKALKKKKPVAPLHQSSSCGSNATSSSALPRRSLTLPSLPSMITKKVAHLQHQFNIAEGTIL